MNKWIAGTACAAAVLSFSVVSAQTYPQTSDQKPATRSAPATKSGQRTTNRPAANRPQPITVTGCVMQGILSNATMSNEASNQTSITNSSTSRSGSPSNEGTTATNRNGTAGAGVSGSTSTVVGTRGTNATIGGNIDTEAHGAGTLGATDQAGSTVGAGATAGAYHTGQPTGASGTSSPNVATSYQLSGITNPNEYSGKRVEIRGTVVNTRVNASARRNSNASSGSNTTPMLRVTSVRVLGDTCQ
jgi:hypothetical protein